MREFLPALLTDAAGRRKKVREVRFGERTFMQSVKTQSAPCPGDEEAEKREQLILEHLPYVKRIVNRIAIHLPPGVDTDELVNVGVIGLIQALDRFDSSRDNKFTTFAAFRIRGAVLSELRARDFLSRSSRRKIREVEKAVMKLEQRYGREVDDNEVAESLGIDLEELHRIKQLAGISFISYEDLGGAAAIEKDALAAELTRNETDFLDQAGLKELRAGLTEAIAELSVKEQMVLSLYYSDELTMKEAGEVLGVTESRVSQLHSQAVMQLRSKLRRRQLLDSP
jgi:RNA polymerase sigma factor for flagellar operon FliA